MLALDDEPMIAMTWTQRRAALADYVAAIGSQHLWFSAHYDDGAALIAAANRSGAEGVVSKRRNAPYRAHQTGDWMRVKTATWGAANADREMPPRRAVR